MLSKVSRNTHRIINFQKSFAATLSSPTIFSQNQMSFGQSESDFTASSLYELNNINNIIENTSFKNNVSFASPESDFSSPTLEEISESIEVNDDVSSRYSFATALSDFFTPNLKETNENIKSELKNDKSNEEVTSTYFSMFMSFSSPESDFVQPTLEEIEESIEVCNKINQKYSYANPYCDFVKSPLTALHSDLPQTRAAVGFEEPSNQARVITEGLPPFAILAVNAQWEQLCGYTIEEARGKTLGLLQGPDSNESITKRINLAAERNLACESVLTNYNKNGKAFKNRLRIQPLDDGTLLGVLEDLSVGKTTDNNDNGSDKNEFDDLEDGFHRTLGLNY